MTPFKLTEIGNLKNDLFHVDNEDRETVRELENFLCGLYDGYFYKTKMETFVTYLRYNGYKGLSIRLSYIIKDVSKYKFSS